MTALKRYARLESTGVWREGPDAQRRDVAIAFGDSSLVVYDRADTPLTHWSLAAVRRLNPGRHPAVYSPGADAMETIEIDDPTMVEAIETVRTLIARRRPQPGRLRIWLFALSLASVTGLALFWLPDALLRHTLSVLPPATRMEIGQALLSRITRISGQPCRSELGLAALRKLEARLLGPGGGTLLVLPEGVRTTAHLPGGHYLISRALVEDHETPDVVAGYILAETLRRAAEDPVERLLEHAGTLATFRLLTTGELPESSIAAHAEALLTAEPAPVDTEALLARFAAAKVPSSPYAYAEDVTGESTVALIEADPMWEGGAEPVLADADWVSLQAICTD
jgi:hypothetical protein